MGPIVNEGPVRGLDSPGFQIGHSYFVPDDGDVPSDDWYTHIVATQIAPLLREYWFDSPEDVEKEVARLTADA